MKSGKLITGLAVGAVVALILVPQTRKMIADAISSLSDSFNDIVDKADNLAQKGKNEVNTIADKTKDLRHRLSGSFDDAKKAYNKEVEALLNSGKSGIDSLKSTLKV